ncbi:transglycosylase SLT domain-containing protein [Escherichia coli]|nr:transglycosylase SLT domain-containing protein [Escherichia coli]ELJ0490742.1 transglycosylase SLT domain-containing protein [Escherichia coli O82]EEQ9038344.1 transglycosylase SLT domain-containing protein [Escherichia coli]EEV4501206.1 transglycosylase SLT domain-containing protein [Escherichia coli]EEZ2648765.1 transglycosylase SLT domain-containing protein [Escherichia coli]
MVLLVVRTTNLLSLFVEWVKLFPDDVTRGEKMRKWLLTICLMFINVTCKAGDCFDLAGRDYKIDPDLLRAISWKESRNRINAIGINPVTGYGSGLMQVDSQHFNELARYGIKPEHLTADPCLNIYTGAYYLAIAFKKWGVSWEAVGAYNAGFRKTERQNQRRLAYASDVYRIYSGIKNSKGIQLRASEKPLSKMNSSQKN